MSDTTQSSPAPDAVISPVTPPLQIVTVPLQKATLCYTPATPQPPAQSPVTPDQPTTSPSSDSAPCYTPAIASPAGDPGTLISPDPASTNAISPAPTTPATCSPAHQSLFQLTPIQRQALDLLHAGHSVSTTARILGLHRVTVQRWKTHHPRFIAELAHRAGLSRIETSLKAQRALDVALSILLKHLAPGSKDAQQIALRLIASPRLSRLASASSSVSLRDAVSQLQQLRTTAAPTDASADPLLLTDLLGELDAPIPADPPKLSKPKPRPEPAKKLPWGPPPKPTLKERYANHPIRPELMAAFQQYGCTPEQVDIAARRPDLAPFDIHFFAILCEPSTITASILAKGYSDDFPPCGVEAPFNPDVLAKMISRGMITRLAGHDTTGCTVTVDPATKALTLSHPARPAITIPHAHLWRDAVLAQ